jgi:FkbM family methyltransferase
MSLEIIEDHSLITRFLNHQSIVVDLGANRGVFSKKMIERFHSKCIAVEPSPKMFSLIDSHELLQKYNFAITASTGSVDFYISDIPVASSLAYKPQSIAETITVPGKRLDDFIFELGFSTIDVLKMDIEGGEIEVIRSCSDDLLKSIGQITIEFHDHLGCVSKSDIKDQIKRLEGLGFLHYSRYINCY